MPVLEADHSRAFKDPRTSKMLCELSCDIILVSDHSFLQIIIHKCEYLSVKHFLSVVSSTSEEAAVY